VLLAVRVGVVFGAVFGVTGGGNEGNGTLTGDPAALVMWLFYSRCSGKFRAPFYPYTV
tara:strand:+ start:2814 stop:2987 length:174 start_codon:yes stop_codon:yes gene_type:complete